MDTMMYIEYIDAFMKEAKCSREVAEAVCEEILARYFNMEYVDQDMLIGLAQELDGE